MLKPQKLLERKRTHRENALSSGKRVFEFLIKIKCGRSGGEDFNTAMIFIIKIFQYIGRVVEVLHLIYEKKGSPLQIKSKELKKILGRCIQKGSVLRIL